MDVYNIDKSEILTQYNLDLGTLIEDTIIKTIPEVKEVKEEGHWVTLKTYPNGGKDVEWVIDKEGVQYQPEKMVTEKILVYREYTQEELEKKNLEKLRVRRELECFPIINRGQCWYNKLTEAQKIELDKWYEAWLDVTDTKIVPNKPTWLK